MPKGSSTRSLSSVLILSPLLCLVLSVKLRDYLEDSRSECWKLTEYTDFRKIFLFSGHRSYLCLLQGSITSMLHDYMTHQWRMRHIGEPILFSHENQRRWCKDIPSEPVIYCHSGVNSQHRWMGTLLMALLSQLWIQLTLYIMKHTRSHLDWRGQTCLSVGGCPILLHPFCCFISYAYEMKW